MIAVLLLLCLPARAEEGHGFNYSLEIDSEGNYTATFVRPDPATTTGGGYLGKTPGNGNVTTPDSVAPGVSQLRQPTASDPATASGGTADGDGGNQDPAPVTTTITNIPPSQLPQLLSDLQDATDKVDEQKAKAARAAAARAQLHNAGTNGPNKGTYRLLDGVAK